MGDVNRFRDVYKKIVDEQESRSGNRSTRRNAQPISNTWSSDHHCVVDTRFYCRHSVWRHNWMPLMLHKWKDVHVTYTVMTWHCTWHNWIESTAFRAGALCVDIVSQPLPRHQISNITRSSESSQYFCYSACVIQQGNKTKTLAHQQQQVSRANEELGDGGASRESTLQNNLSTGL